jgi:Domain of unknown function (DUF1707)/Domain of unknown function (DUF4190)
VSYYGAPQRWDDSPADQMRASHADRERAVDVLKAGFAEGRLSPQEYEQRVGLAYQSHTYGELAALVRDLPQGPVPMRMPVQQAPVPVVVPPTFLPVPHRPTNGLAAASLICGLAGTIFFVPAVPAIVLGHMAHGQIRRQHQGGEGAATAGLVLGYLALLFWTVIIVQAIASHG